MLIRRRWFCPNVYFKLSQDIQKKLSDIAKNNNLVTFMANYVGESGGYKCAGKSSVWDTTGKLIGQLDSETEGILIYDTETKEIVKKTEWAVQ